MEYQKMINLQNNVSTQPSKCRTKMYVEINDDRNEKYSPNDAIRF